MENPWKPRFNAAKSLIMQISIVPSHGRGRRFNPYSAHQHLAHKSLRALQVFTAGVPIAFNFREAALSAASLFCRAVFAGEEHVMMRKISEQLGPLREIGGQHIWGIARDPLR
jgi:hypothetical protein